MNTLTILLLSLAPLLLGAAQDGSGPWRLTIAVDTAAGAVAAGDMDGDGRPDLVVACAGDGTAKIQDVTGPGEVGILRVHHVPAGLHPVDIALRDLDEDGDLDLAVANHDTDHITLLVNDGVGGLQPARDSPLRLGLDPHPHAVSAVDIDGDGHIDLLVDERNREGLRLLRGRGDGTFITPGSQVPVGGDPYRGMALGDVNGDGHVDLVTPNPRQAALLLGTGAGFAAPRPIPATRPFTVALADLTADGTLDLVAASEGGQLEIFRGDGDGGFAITADRWREPSGARKAVAGDFDGDGVDDVAIVNWMSPEVLLLMGSPAGVRRVRFPAGENPWGLAVADLNRDACDDLAVLNEGDDELLVLISRRVGERCAVGAAG